MSRRGLLRSISSPSSLHDNGTIRIALLGAAKVGKTSIIHQFLDDHFEKSYKKTVEEMHRAELNYHGQKVTLEILDTAGAYDFPAMRSLAISRSDVIVLVYSMDNFDSFSEISDIRQTIWEERGLDDVPIVVVGNKSDLAIKNRIVSRATAEGIACMDWNTAFVEVSAKDNESVTNIFQEALRSSRIDFDLKRALHKRRQSLPLPVTRIKADRSKDDKKWKKSFPFCFSIPRSKSI